MIGDDYLWDGSGEPDPEVRRLEELLGTLRSRRPAPELPEGAIRVQRLRLPVVLPALAASLVALLAASAWLATRWSGPATSGWRVARLQGSPRVGPAPVVETGRLAEGDWLETDAVSRARLSLAGLGRVEVGPGTLLRLATSRSGEQRLRLQRGAISAFISAPPRLFLVETPSALAVDLGCAYRLEVDEAGAGRLAVTSGWVALEGRDRQSIVPYGAGCATRPGSGPGTPHFADAPQALREALETLDAAAAPADEEDAALDLLLPAARPRDALSLWHLLARLDGGGRERVFERLAVLAPPPEGVSREGILRGDRRMLRLWWGVLGLGGGPWLDAWERAGRRASSIGAIRLAPPAGAALLLPGLAAVDASRPPDFKDEDLPSRVTVTSADEPGITLIVTGTIYLPDGRIPAAGAILDFYHTDARGYYNREGIREPRLKGRLRTGAAGQYEFRTIRPASYPGRTVVAHIHAKVSAPGYPERWIPDYLFDDDPLLTPAIRSEQKGEGRFSPILKPERGADGVLRAARDIRLESP